MTTYRLLDGASGRPGTGSSSGITPPSSGVSYGGAFQAGTCFVATQSGTWFEGFWWWVPAGGDTGSQQFALWSLSGPLSPTFTLVPGATVISGMLTAGAWNWVPLAAPVQLSVGQVGATLAHGGLYIATTGWTATRFPDTNNVLGNGNPFSGGITSGPLFCPGEASGGNTVPGSTFGTSYANATTAPPVNTDATWDLFWLDVQVSDTPPTGYAGSWRLWPNRHGPNGVTSADSAVDYCVATEVKLTAACSPQWAWYYSPAGCSQLATRASIWQVTGTTGTEAVAVTSPSWVTPDGSAAATAGAGWCKCAIPPGTVLPPGRYKVSVYNDSATPDGWSAKDAASDYWQSGEGATGITWGPLSAPNLAGASQAYTYGGLASNSPPYSDGTGPIAHGQPTFSQMTAGTAVPSYPDLYAPVGSPATQTQNYWVDLEVLSAPYRLFPATSGPSTATPYSGDYIAGVMFQVTRGGMWFEGYWWWVCPNGGLTVPQECALWSIGFPGGSATLVPGSVVTSGTLSAGWNYIPLATPLQLAAGTPYSAATAVNGAFPDTQHQFGSGGPYGGGITAGPLAAYSDAGGSSPAPYGHAQGGYTVAGGDPAVWAPLSGNVSDNLWVDVQVSDQAPAGYTGSWRLWPNKFDASPATIADAALDFVLATEVSLAQDCYASWVWFFSVSGSVSLPTWCGVYEVSGQSLAAASTSPSWVTPDGGTAATAGGGWCKAALPAGTLLAAGDYKVAVYNASGTSGDWSPTEYGYWKTGAGASGLAAGPLSSPASDSGSAAYVYFSAPGATPPYTSGAAQEAANGTFAITGPQYPYLAVDYAYPGTSDPAGAVGESFWTDLEVTPAFRDQGGSADAEAVTATLAVADAGGAADSLAITVYQADEGGAADAESVTAASALAEEGAATDAESVTVAAALADPGGAADALAVAVTAALADAGGAGDSAAIAVPAAPADEGGSADAEAVTVAGALADAGGAADTLAVAVALALADEGGSADAFSLSHGGGVGDAGGATDALSVTPGAASLADAGGAADALAVTVALAVADAAGAGDAFGGGARTLVAVAYGGTITAASALGGTPTVSPGPASYAGALAVTANSYAGTATEDTMQEVDIILNSFNDMTVSFAITASGTEMNLAGYTVNMLLKPQRGIADNASGVLKLSSAGTSPAVTITSAATGQCSAIIPSASLTPSAFSFYRVDVVNGSGQQDTAIYGTVTTISL